MTNVQTFRTYDEYGRFHGWLPYEEAMKYNAYVEEKKNRMKMAKMQEKMRKKQRKMMSKNKKKNRYNPYGVQGYGENFGSDVYGSEYYGSGPEYGGGDFGGSADF